MSKIGTKTAQTVAPQTAALEPLSAEDKSKDAFFTQVAQLAEAMIAKHGKDFAIGTLVLSAKFVAEGKPFIKRTDGGM